MDDTQQTTAPAPAAPEAPAAPAPAAPATPAPEAPKPAEPAQDNGTDWKAEARKWETRAKENKDARAELDKRQQAEMTETQKAQAIADKANAELTAAKREAAMLRAAVDHGLTPDDLELLDGIPADQIGDRAAKLSARIKSATPPGTSGNEVGGGKGAGKPDTLTGALSAHLNK